ncbi:calcium-binding protein [Asticcacaulis sp. AC402]|uniref:calcium-binding protein n=1 Tax=Asticcacaulis sp. AC402 TaxID=1282361 RepID=UPI0003C3EF27|nr:calcium-binding protein [Asticcacaulis sp. AC402]ESQ74455.1 hypothetical protein ABAC402_14145 [Asticcacaulis sp. AC402]
MAYFPGTPDNDIYTGGVGNDEIKGLGGDDILISDAGQDTLFGGDGHDWIDGGAGDDIMGGSSGNDTFVVDSAGDTIIEWTNQGTDTVRASISFSLAGRQIELLTLTGASHINATGNGFNNVLIGNSGNNVLDGGVGADMLQGGLGDDIYYVDHAGDNVVEAHFEGSDTVISSITYALFGRAVENLILTGAGHINATGNSLANILTGNSGKNVLDGQQGIDTMSGGPGDDTYYVNSTSDVVVEANGQGYDRVFSSATFSLAGQFAEVLVLTGAGNTDATGNSSKNLLIGNNGNNELDGSSGDDTLEGGAGDDTYYLGLDKNDVVIEAIGGGNDTIHTGARSFTLVGLQVENLRMRGDSREGFGNDLDNRITGNGYNNLLYGGAGNDTLDGGAAHDVMTGGTGDDVYYVGSLYDVVNEDADGGIDWVMGGNSQPLFANVENLTLLNANNVNATGNGLDNRLEGNTGNNSLTGGGGADLFVFLLDSGTDRINDMNGAEGDRIDISAYTGGVAAPALVTQSGANVLIDLGDGNTVLILTDTVDNVTPYIIW